MSAIDEVNENNFENIVSNEDESIFESDMIFEDEESYPSER